MVSVSLACDWLVDFHGWSGLTRRCKQFRGPCPRPAKTAYIVPAVPHDLHPGEGALMFLFFIPAPMRCVLCFAMSLCGY